MLTSAAPTRKTRKRSTATAPAADSDSASKAKTPSYLLQRKERDALADEVRALDAQLEELRIRAGLPSKQDRQAIHDVEAQNFDLEEKLVLNDLFLARLQSKVTSEMLAPVVNPMSTFIHLPTDMAQRRAILHDMRELKLRRGIDAATQHLYHLDHLIPYLSEQRFKTESGEYHCHRLEINQFSNFSSARQLYDTFVDFLYHTAENVTAGLGQLALREDSDDKVNDSRTIWHHRIVTIEDDVGCTEELNSVGFAEFYDYSPRTASPMGIVVYDTVNVDDLYPYIPEERTSKDVQAAHMVFEVRSPDSDDVIVVLKQCLFCVQLVPQFDLAPQALDQLQRNSTRWCAYIIKYLREYVPADGRV